MSTMKTLEPMLRPEFGMLESSHSKVTVTYVTSESTDKIFDRLARYMNPIADDNHILSVSVTETKRTSWTRAREYREMGK